MQQKTLHTYFLQVWNRALSFSGLRCKIERKHRAQGGRGVWKRSETFYG